MLEWVEKENVGKEVWTAYDSLSLFQVLFGLFLETTSKFSALINGILHSTSFMKAYVEFRHEKAFLRVPIFLTLTSP